MNCKEAYSWLLGAESPAQPAPEVRQHLVVCARCRQRQQRLEILDREVQATVPADASPPARTFLEMCGGSPHRRDEATPSVAPARHPAPRLPRLIVALAAVILIAIGLGAWLRLSENSTTTAHSTGPRLATLDRLLENDLKLAQATTTSAQLCALAGMADDLQTEALYLAGNEAVDDLAIIRHLYEGIVGQGLVERAHHLNDNEKNDLMPELRRSLERSARELELLPASADVRVNEHVQGIAAIARQTSGSLAPLAPVAPPRKWESPVTEARGTPRALCSVLVLNGLRLAQDPDPLRRADYCSDIADIFMQNIIEASAPGQEDRLAFLGQGLSAVLDRGVAPNLALAEVAGADRRAEVERVRRRGAAAAVALEQVLAKAPAAARPALQRALEKAKGKGSDGPPAGLFTPSGKGVWPPGLQKLPNGKPKLHDPEDD
jgi:hypothetical protein